MPLDREKAREALLDIGVFDDGWNVSQLTVTEVLDAIEPYVTPRLAEVDARIISEAEAKLARVRALHEQDPNRTDRSVCIECTRWLKANAPDGSNGTAVWPCPTVQILLDAAT